MKANEFVARLFMNRDVSHIVHLSTRSYAKHMALNDFYHEIIELADDFAETYQGRYGLLNKISLVSPTKVTNIADFLQSELDEIEKQRYAFLDKSDTALQNIVDEIVGLYLKTIYKLKYLA